MDYRKNPYIGTHNRNIKYDNNLSTDQQATTLPPPNSQSLLNPLHNDIYRNQTLESESRRRWVTNASVALEFEPQSIPRTVPPSVMPAPHYATLVPPPAVSSRHMIPSQPPIPFHHRRPPVNHAHFAHHRPVGGGGCPYMRRVMAPPPPQPPTLLMWGGQVLTPQGPAPPFPYRYLVDPSADDVGSRPIVARPFVEDDLGPGTITTTTTEIGVVEEQGDDSVQSANTNSSEYPDELLLTFLHRLFDNGIAGGHFNNVEPGASSAMISEHTLEYRYATKTPNLDRASRRKRRRCLEEEKAGPASEELSSQNPSSGSGHLLLPMYESCAICLSELRRNEKVRRLPCFHLYHSPCIDRWLKNCKRCPMCRFAIDANASTPPNPIATGPADA